MDAREQLAVALRRTRDATVATYALVLYEFLIMLDREYEAIYKSSWSLAKCLYLTCRFGLLFFWPIGMYAFLFDHDEETCKPFLIIVLVLFLFIPCAPQCLYVLRAYAITGAKRLSLLIYLPCLFAYLFFVSWHSLSGVTLVKEVFLISGRSGCFPDRYNRYFEVPLAGIALDGVVGLTLVIHFIRLQGPQTRFGNLLATQGILYFPLMFLLNAGAVVVSSIGSHAYKALVLYVIITIPNIMACRFMLQIREYGSNDPNSSTMFSRARREVERAFPIGPLPVSTGTDSPLALSNGSIGGGKDII